MPCRCAILTCKSLTEVAEELKNQVLLLLLHLVLEGSQSVMMSQLQTLEGPIVTHKTVLSPAREHLLLGKTLSPTSQHTQSPTIKKPSGSKTHDTGVGLQQLLRDGPATAGSVLLILVVINVTILGLELLDQGIDVLIFLFLMLLLLRHGRRGGLLLLVELARLDLRVQRRGGGRIGLSHGGWLLLVQMSAGSRCQSN